MSCTFNTNTLKTWNKTTTHILRMYIIWRVDHYRSMDRERGEIYALLTQTHTQNMKQDNNSQTENVHNMASGTLLVNG